MKEPYRDPSTRLARISLESLPAVRARSGRSAFFSYPISPFLRTIAALAFVGMGLQAGIGTGWLACSTDVQPTSSRTGQTFPIEYDFPEPKDLPRQPDPPDPFVLFETGEEVLSAMDWERRRRPEIKALFEFYVYGKAPGRPEQLTWTLVEQEPEALNGLATRKQVDIRLGGPGAPTLHLLIYVPNAVPGPPPVFLGLNFYGNHTVIQDPAVPLSDQWIPERGEGVVDHRATEASRGTATERWAIEQNLRRGYAVATAYHGDIDPDFDDFSNGIHPLYYEEGQTRPAPAEWGTVAAWAWGLSRVMDYLETDARLDGSRVAVMGHSRNGKAALLAGAFDERFAVVISNQSGCTGAALSRHRSGETVLLINLVFPHWFCTHYKAFNEREARLPVDQHLLVSLVAPRPVLVLSAACDLWSDPQGEFLGAKGADPVYNLLGAGGLDTEDMPEPDLLVGDPLGYHLRRGDHSIGPHDWDVFADFADRYLKP